MMNDAPKDPKKKEESRMVLGAGVGVALGAGLGTALGAALGNVGVGVAMGA